MIKEPLTEVEVLSRIRQLSREEVYVVKASIYADVVEENISSVKILNSLGFEQLGVEQNKFQRGNELQNVIKYRKKVEKKEQ